MEERIYLDNCKTTKPAPEVIEAVLPYLTEKFYFPGDFVSTKVESAQDIENFKNVIAKNINANTNEIHFTSGGTSANNIAIKGILSSYKNKGKHIICSIVDYPDLLTNAAYFEQNGFDVSYISADWDGFINLEELKDAIRPDTILFMTTMVNHTMGTIQPMNEIKQILESADHKIYYHIDACQAFGKIEVDVNKLGADTLSLSGHKIHGIQGVGALYVRKGVVLNLSKHGIARIDNLETGAINIGAIAGFAKATELIFEDFENINKRLRSLSNYLLEKIEANIPHIILNGPRGEKRAPHNINVTFEFIEGEAIMMMMDMYNIDVDTGSACASQGLKANYILMGCGRNHEQSHGSMKFTLSRYNTKEEIDYVVEKLTEIVKELRRRSPLYQEEN